MCIAEGKDELQGKICGQSVYVRILKRLLLFSYTELCKNFIEFLYRYYDFGNREILKLKNKVLFSLDNEKDYYQSIIYYISGMTDNFAIEMYNEIVSF